MNSDASFVADSEPERVEIREKVGSSSRTPINLGIIEIPDSDSDDSGSSLTKGEPLNRCEVHC